MTLGLGLGGGYLTIKINSLWDAALPHAGADVFCSLAFALLSVG